MGCWESTESVSLFSNQIAGAMKSILLLLAVAAINFAAAEDACEGKDYGKAGEFDFYVFNEGWEPQFCFPSSHSSWPGCVNSTAWMQVNLTLHGLWPQYNSKHDDHLWPQCCESQYGRDVDPSVVKTLLPDLQLYWPNEKDMSGSPPTYRDSLWGHEWNKHGTCSGMSQHEYFTKAMSILVARGTPAVVSNNVGGSVDFGSLQKAYNAADCAHDGSSPCIVGLECTSDHQGQQYFSGTTSCYSKADLKPIMCPSAVLSPLKHCKSGSINIQSF